MNKYAALANGNAKVNRLILANIAEYAQIQALVEEFTINPSPELAEQIDVQFQKVSSGMEAVRNSISVLANMVVSDEVEEVDVTFDEHGARLM